jgi:hypothetical protein
MNNYGYNAPNYMSSYSRANYGMNNYTQPQYAPQPQQIQPQIVQQPIMQQPIVQQAQQGMQSMEMPFNYFGYGNYKEVESLILFPNQKALFIDRANNMYYEKNCNNDGISVISQYKRVEDKAENQAVETRNDTPTIDLSNYATKDDLGQFVSLKQYEELLNKFEELKSMLNKE